jgi:hypothetical protein
MANPAQLKMANVKVAALPQSATNSFTRRPIVPITNNTKAVNLTVLLTTTPHDQAVRSCRTACLHRAICDREYFLGFNLSFQYHFTEIFPGPETARTGSEYLNKAPPIFGVFENHILVALALLVLIQAHEFVLVFRLHVHLRKRYFTAVKWSSI